MKYSVKYIIQQTIWVLIGISTVVLFTAAVSKKQQLPCNNIKVTIESGGDLLFLDEKAIVQIASTYGQLPKIPVGKLPLRSIEKLLRTNPWIKNAEIYIDNQQVLQIKITERTPIVRLFTIDGNSCYADSSGYLLPLSKTVTARVPVVTNLPVIGKNMTAVDSSLYKGIISLANHVAADSFWNAQVAQINVTQAATIEVIPSFGNHIIELGEPTDIPKKLKKLQAFYTQIWIKKGINTYAKLNAAYNNQVIAIQANNSIENIDTAKSQAIVEQLTQPSFNTVLVDTIAKARSTAIKTVNLNPISPKTNKETTKNNLTIKEKKNTKPKNKTLSIVEKKQPKAVLSKKQVGKTQKP
ncbi:MAG: cell division protein FtsQ/DivIB [Chitinophagaceae bacterium]